ncbi:uncharacterized protein BT62DRAFT_1001667 [Guyanagaster necrorhizus]|uniref:Uncharacterized protein n=1 Tax=Guyanagaster necrorhizus TaxID=856835 RepID=A0A9P7W3X7_9AGAR|nr:uncharacterized protein BT62DRAFT_1001667 [Guyanagaster necrorhizus MCA 3950]KAG7450851.1 hypothetical protein BT62DRAFT_1001667 [Guyanagaster necrorhizus MCA 3950]
MEHGGKIVVENVGNGDKSRRHCTRVLVDGNNDDSDGANQLLGATINNHGQIGLPLLVPHQVLPLVGTPSIEQIVQVLSSRYLEAAVRSLVTIQDDRQLSSYQRSVTSGGHKGTNRSLQESLFYVEERVEITKVRSLRFASISAALASIMCFRTMAISPP